MIRLDGIERRFGPLVLFRDLSWMIVRGARLGLVGPNGAGKTTILRILHGDDEPDAGRLRKAGSVRVAYLPQEVETVGEGNVLPVVLDGFRELRELEERLEATERRLAAMAPGDPELETVTSGYGELRQRFETLGGDRVEAKAKAILSGLGVPEGRFHEPVARLSGGWRMRVLLARLLLGEPDLLLLDEPTNHLDLEAIGWLEGFLEGYEGAFVVVSHDRYFLNRMVRGIVELNRGRLTVYTGNYDDYIAEREARREAAEEAARHQAREVARVERFIERFRYKASKARQVQSRIRALSKLERAAGPAPESRRIRFGFPQPPRSGDIVVRAEDVAKSFGALTVYRRLDLVLRRGDRVALVGPNGAGKSTLVKLLTGRLVPDAGRVELGHNVHVQYYAQHQLEALDPGRTVLEEVEAMAGPGTRPRLRQLLGAFLFSGDDVDKRIAVLSGGEKARVALAKLLIHPSNFLLMDEPTNHLDLRSREVLEDALDEYTGTLVVISHDRYFINRIATSIGEVGDGSVRVYPGDYDTYLEHLQARRPAAMPVEVESDGTEGTDVRLRAREARRAEAEERNRRYRERRAVEVRLEPIEAEIASLEETVRRCTEAQADPEVYSDPERARQVGRERGAAEARLGELYAAWESLARELPE